MSINPTTDSSNALGEISHAVKEFFFDTLEQRLPNVFNRTNDPSQVLVCPSTTIESDFNMRQLRRHKNDQTEGVILPFAAVSRIGQIDSQFFHSPRTYDFYEPLDSDPSLAQSWKLFTVYLSFSFRLYTERFDEAEAITEKLLIMAKKNQSVTYTSKVLNMDNILTILIGSPEMLSVAGSNEKFKGAGYIYAVTVPLAVTAPIGEYFSEENVKLITRIDEETYARSKDRVTHGVDTPDDILTIED